MTTPISKYIVVVTIAGLIYSVVGYKIGISKAEKGERDYQKLETIYKSTLAENNALKKTKDVIPQSVVERKLYEHVRYLTTIQSGNQQSLQQSLSSNTVCELNRLTSYIDSGDYQNTRTYKRLKSEILKLIKNVEQIECNTMH